jgi:myo-inositol-1(or 4)-monophosphatase
VAVVTGDPLDPAGHQVVAGCVHHPLSRETWTATLGGGAFLDGRPIRVNTGVPLNRALVATGFGYDAERRRHAARVVAEVLPQVRDIRRIGSAALDLAGLACGRLDAYYERGLGAWDLAAGGLIAREAGALMGGLDGAPAGPELVVAAGPGLYENLQALLLPLRPDRDGGGEVHD